MDLLNLLDKPRQWQHLINLAGGAYGFHLARSADGGPTLLAGGLLMVWLTVRSICIDVRQVEAEKSNKPDPAIEFQEARALAEGKLRAAQMEPRKPVVNDWAKPAIHGGLVLQNLTVKPVIDKERVVAQTLNDQRIGGLKMDISESFWLRNGHWTGTPEEFRSMRAKWEHYQIVGKKSAATNSPYEVQNERGIELIATGKLRLPTPPGLM